MAREDRMTNRLIDYLGPEERPEVEFWHVSTRTDWFYVDEATALRLLSEIGRRRPKKWLRFRDIFGSNVGLLSRDVVSIAQSTVRSRELARLFRNALTNEEPREDPWDAC